MRNETLSLALGELPQKPTRDGFGTGTVEAGKKDSSVVVLCADLAESTRADWFRKEFPDRYIELGVAEQNLAAVASGMAALGKIPYIASYAAFSPGRNWEQIRTTIALNGQKIVVCGMHAGVSVGPDGATHQMLEDVAIMRAIPHMRVVVPADAEEARKATYAAAFADGPTYIRFGRSNVPVFTTPATPFAFSEAYRLFDAGEGKKVGIVSTGALSYEALMAAEELSAKGVPVAVLHVPTIKPFPEDALLALAKEVAGIVSVEEHQITGGLGSAVAEVLARRAPRTMCFVGMQDSFGQSGEPMELLAHYGLDRTGIERAVLELAQDLP